MKQPTMPAFGLVLMAIAGLVAILALFACDYADEQATTDVKDLCSVHTAKPTCETSSLGCVWADEKCTSKAD